MVSKISQRTTSGTILLPAVALWLIAQPFGGFNVVFAVAIALASIGACMSVLLSRYAPKTNRNPQAVDAAPWWREILNILDREIILASVLSFFSHVTFPAVASFLVLYACDIGVDNIGWFYAVSGTTSILARPILGKVSDNIGRRRALVACFILQALALVMLAYAANLIALMISGVLYMLGLAMSSSTTLVIAMEQANPNAAAAQGQRSLSRYR